MNGNEQIQDTENKPIVTTTLNISELKHSIKPAIEESEKFIQFLNKRFNLGLKDDLIILIHETKPRIKGYFRSVKCQKIWIENTAFKQQKLNSIVLSSHTLKTTPYETLAHELAHYINFINGIKDCSNSQYHNKRFKEQAEKLLLKVEKTENYGFAYTEMTEEFKMMLETEFKPNEKAFSLFQELEKPKNKSPTRNLLFECSCGCKIRTARNEFKPLMAICQYCNTQFEEVI